MVLSATAAAAVAAAAAEFTIGFYVRLHMYADFPLFFFIRAIMAKRAAVILCLPTEH